MFVITNNESSVDLVSKITDEIMWNKGFVYFVNVLSVG